MWQVTGSPWFLAFRHRQVFFQEAQCWHGGE
jgi:hypothetical protein